MKFIYIKHVSVSRLSLLQIFIQKMLYWMRAIEDIDKIVKNVIEMLQDKK